MEAKERNIYKKPDTIQTGTQDLEKNPPCNAEDNLRAGLIAIEAWFGGYRGSPGLGGVWIAGLSSRPDSKTMKIQD